MLLCSKRLLLVVMIFGLFSCQKENIIDNTEPEISIPTIAPIKNNNLVKRDLLKDQAIIGGIVLKDIISMIFMETLYHPELFGFQSDPTAELRMCPTTQNNPTGTDPFPTNFILTYGCSPAAMQPVNITGTITAFIEAPIFTQTSSEDIAISLSNDFQIGNYKVQVANGGTIDLYYLSSGSNPRYRVEFEEDVIVTDCSGGPTDGFTTTYHSTDDFGDIDVVDEPMPDGDDDPDVPFTYLNNVFTLLIRDNQVTCKNTNTNVERNFCMDTASGERLEFQPSACGCIQQGSVRVNELASGEVCGSTTVTSANSTTYDFGIDENGDDDGDCDDSVEIEGNAVPQPLQSCS